MVGYRLCEADREALAEVFDKMDNGMLREVVWMIENLVMERRKCLTARERYVNQGVERRIREKS